MWTLCSTWTGNASNQSLNGDNQATLTLTNGGAGNDSVAISSSVCTPNVGSLALGPTGYTTATVTFGAAGANRTTLDWNAAALTLTITLGQVSAAGPATVSSSIVSYSPTGILTTTATAIGGPFITANVKQF